MTEMASVRKHEGACVWCVWCCVCGVVCVVLRSEANKSLRADCVSAGEEEKENR